MGRPALPIFAPRGVPFVPAVFSRLMQSAPLFLRPPAVPAVMLDGFVQFVVRLGDAALAAAVVIRECTRSTAKGHQSNERHSREHCLPEKVLPSRLKFHVLSILPYSPWLAGLRS